MNSFYKFFIIIPLLILGCKPNYQENIKFLQRLETLNMDIYSKDGEKIYTIKSPNSSFNNQTQTFNLQRTKISIYSDGKTKYEIISDGSKLSNSNETIELIGNVELRTFEQDDDIINAQYFSWNFDDTVYVLKGDVKFENTNLILSSNKAILNKENIIEFYNPVEYIVKNNIDVNKKESDNYINQKSYEIKSENAFYNLDTKSLRFSSQNNRVRSKIYF